jgi:hypothetical protein
MTFTMPMLELRVSVFGGVVHIMRKILPQQRIEHFVGPVQV